MQGVPEDKKPGLVEAVRNDTLVLGRLNEIVDQLIAKTYRIERSSETYDKPNWAEKQAHMNGYLQAMTQIKDLLNVTV